MAKSSASHIRTLGQANPGKKAIGGGKATSVSFKPAKNGLISSVSSDGGMDYKEPEHTIHSTMSHAVQHLKQTFGHVFDKESED